MFFSDVFGVTEDSLKDYGAVNISLLCDIPLFIDPMLIFSSDRSEYAQLHERVTKYFHFLSKKSESSLSKREIIYYFGFPEIKNNWLGYSKSGNGGSGNGDDFAHLLHSNIQSVFNMNNISNSTHIEKISLLGQGSGKDKISDMFTNLLLDFFLEYTQCYALEFIDRSKIKEFRVDRVYFNYDTEYFEPRSYSLPYIINKKGKEEFVMLTPSDILRADEPAINMKNFANSYQEIIYAIDNEALRNIVWRHINTRVSEYENQLKDERKISERQISKVSRDSLIEISKENKVIYDYYIKMLEENIDSIINDSELERKGVIDLFINNTIDFISSIKIQEIPEDRSDVRMETIQRIKFFKDRIEHGDVYRVFYKDGEPIAYEDDFQRLFTLVWNGTLAKLAVETNNGRGPVDFNASIGKINQVNVEFKLASNSKLKNVFKQVDIYNDAHETDQSIIVVAFFNGVEQQKVLDLINDSEREIVIDENFFLIDCRVKESASKV